MVMLIIGRFIAGVAVGMLTSVIPMYAGEIAESSSRGMMSGLLQWMLSWGYFVAQWLGYGCSFNQTSFQCKFPFANIRQWVGTFIDFLQGASLSPSNVFLD